TNTLKLQGYCDTDRQMTEGHKAINSYVFQLAKLTISWSSKQQNLVLLSVYEAELQVLVYATQEAIWLKRFAEEVLQTESAPITIYYNNQGTIKTVKSDKIMYNTHTKHLDLQKDFMQCYIQNEYINVCYVQSQNQLADILTKALHVPQIKHLNKLLGIQ
ncbi:uncharacterized protein FOMMEDRAFT_49686, partial [Fomitiporia mediterranea MF3/22]|uniref:uncharacterized protein n=1 Tax=Fomitiporia mediterranea (strain MF3/22) TaxID=694068 RepID=UPI0004408035